MKGLSMDEPEQEPTFPNEKLNISSKLEKKASKLFTIALKSLNERNYEEAMNFLNESLNLNPKTSMIKLLKYLTKLISLE